MTDFLHDAEPVECDAARSARAVQFLINSAEWIGNAKAQMITNESALKRVLAVARRMSSGTNAQARDDEARQNPKCADAEKALHQSIVAYETLRAQRDAAVALIDFWRSKNANQRGAERGM